MTCIGNRPVCLSIATLTMAVAVLAGACAPRPGAAPGPPSESVAARDGMILVVRHAEAFREPGGDPALTPAGEARAGRLAVLLRDSGIRRIHSTELRRTLGTLAPLALRLGLEPEPYDPANLPGLVGRLLSDPGPHLVLGHSNTNPELVALLGGDPGAPIAIEEHDRVYLLVVGRTGVRTMVLRLE